MPSVKYLFVHTAAADIRNVDAVKIDEWHRAKGWNGIGYHYVILDDSHDLKPDGQVETGRAEHKNGAHVYGVNAISLGICCAGHGNIRDFTHAQKQSLVKLLVGLAEKYSVPTSNILGHREVNMLVDQGVVGSYARTTKSCPGDKVDMDAMRSAVEMARGDSGTGPVVGQVSPTDAVEALKMLAKSEALMGDAVDEWRQFLFNGEIQSLIESV
ncbi:N-acetylmuramoyl-L-alanine amidase [Shimia marina]|uniref:Lysozyme n=1 Tax=Shimia marina TaxID=321267 RepID=A0A0N7LSQ5_9RHOB|nr:N-acetylmuramoyl-L-alanine amidase [Shimia marina]CUH54276.1 lysozyme [Shimia marina]SFD99222.1 N-acetylmuramoyl-L-alanine amidase [Shimia marina]